MEKVLNIGNKEIKMKSTAGTMMRYRNQFNRDFIKDLMHLKDSMQDKVDKGTELDLVDLGIFEKIAWCMAKTADDNVPDIEHWLDEFDTFDIYQVLPEIMGLLVANMEQIGSKKKTVAEGEQ